MRVTIPEDIEVRLCAFVEAGDHTHFVAYALHCALPLLEEEVRIAASGTRHVTRRKEVAIRDLHNLEAYKRNFELLTADPEDQLEDIPDAI